MAPASFGPDYRLPRLSARRPAVSPLAPMGDAGTSRGSSRASQRQAGRMGAGSRASATLKNVPRVRVMGTAASLSVGVQHAVPPQPPFDLSAAIQMMARVIDGSLSSADLSRPALAAAKTAACSAAAAACGALYLCLQTSAAEAWSQRLQLPLHARVKLRVILQHRENEI